jgi:tetratricopeptide (TPR) repeat protein
MHPIRTAVAVVLAASASAALADDPTPASEAIGSYQRSIDAIERDGGALDRRLSENFLSMGLAYQANGDLDAAIGAFRQALHVNRIDKGLHHLVHVPIVDLLIDAYAQQGDWHAVDQQQRFRHWIHKREVATNSDEYVRAAMTYAAWQNRAHNLATGTPTLTRLREALSALEAAFTAVTATGDDADPRLLLILNAEAQTRLNVATYASFTDEDIATGGQRVEEDLGELMERRNLIIESFIRGKQALERVAGLTAAQNLDIEHALALANLADWELAFERPQGARENYRRAYEKLQAAGLSQADIEREFGSPRPLKSFSLARRAAATDDDKATPNAYVKAAFRVTKNGKVRAIEILETYPPGNSRIAREARTTLSNTRFRPSIGNDGPFEDTATIRYIFPDVSI